MEIKTEILIHSTPEKVWSILTDFDKYPEWNPFIKYIQGEVKEGNQIKVKIEPEDEKGMKFQSKVLSFQKNRELKWIGRLLFPGIFDGEHQFLLIDNGNNTTTLKHNEKFKGILKGLLNLEKTKKGFESMNIKLKELAESNG
ncbi:SRPBCC family protein [Flammeovirga yaeyamensis]|uniref:SRPBCC family protein n=1 Tax=Flammeovirga yaeyamensis TaxID=367791 RepID=A0AAX1N638_9BACT|nr:SRPBCC domain-containing protein [Flammeovirga yaeyamensis]MBB3701269.1 hypothetical protein [Flammeovirga yaeyamensis]NMF38261.1 SRPBCC domain-containing protein [Flammeovirga yaeyamensis]QWG02672.1 SRPBCC family protein [Flammeovirga yaeyamensis]